MPCWSSTTPRYPRKACVPWVSLRSMPRRWARPRTARPGIAAVGARRSPGHAALRLFLPELDGRPGPVGSSGWLGQYRWLVHCSSCAKRIDLCFTDPNIGSLAMGRRKPAEIKSWRISAILMINRGGPHAQTVPLKLMVSEVGRRICMRCPHADRLSVGDSGPRPNWLRRSRSLRSRGSCSDIRCGQRRFL